MLEHALRGRLEAYSRGRDDDSLGRLIPLLDSDGALPAPGFTEILPELDSRLTQVAESSGGKVPTR